MGRVLFYPCCSSDLQEPIQRFIEQVDGFWFVDKHGVGQVTHVLRKLAYRPTKVELTEYICTGIGHSQHKVVITTETYQQGSRNIVVKRVVGGGIAVMRNLIPVIDIFFYRGDSSGEGGSNVRWLGSKFLPEVLRRLVNKGLLVTDGSNCYGHKHKLNQFHRKDIGEEAISQAKSFRAYSRKFTCIGYAGRKYGPTLIWEVESLDRL